MLRLASSAAGVEYSIKYLPIKRFRDSTAPFIVGDPDLLTVQKHRAIFPIGVFRTAFFYYKPNHAVMTFKGLGGLRGYTLGVLRGTLEDRAYFTRNGIKVEESDSTESLLKKLKKGRIDFCIMVAGTGRYTIKQLLPEEQEDFAQKIIPDTGRPIAIIIDLDAPDGKAVAQRYRKVLRKTLHSPEYHEILARHYGEENIPEDTHEVLNGFVKYYESTWDK